MSGVLLHAQRPVQLSGTYRGRHCEERVEGLVVQEPLLQCCHGLPGCIPRSYKVSLK